MFDSCVLAVVSVQWLMTAMVCHTWYLVTHLCSSTSHPSTPAASQTRRGLSGCCLKVCMTCNNCLLTSTRTKVNSTHGSFIAAASYIFIRWKLYSYSILCIYFCILYFYRYSVYRISNFYSKMLFFFDHSNQSVKSVGWLHLPQQDIRICIVSVRFIDCIKTNYTVFISTKTADFTSFAIIYIYFTYLLQPWGTTLSTVKVIS